MEQVKRLGKKTSTRRYQPAPPKATPPSSFASLARYKAALINEVKSQDVTPERQNSIRAELECEPLKTTPILSVSELERLDG